MNNKKLLFIILRHSVILPIARIIILQVLICLGVAVLVVMAAY